MDYEKLYKDALERAREYKEKGYMMINATLDNIFPELAMSEDDKMRKELRMAVTIAYNYSYFDAKTMDDCIAWLEKQCELKSSKWAEGDVVRHGGILALVTNGRRAMKSNCEQITIQYPDEWEKQTQ